MIYATAAALTLDTRGQMSPTTQPPPVSGDAMTTDQGTNYKSPV